MEWNIIDSNIPIHTIPPTTPKGIPAQRLIELRKKNLSYSEIAKVVGIAKRNVVARFKKLNREIELGKHYKENRADILAIHQAKISESITDANRQKAGLLEKVKSMSFLHNAERLEEGKSTQNIAYADALKARDQVKIEQEDLKKQYPDIDFDNLTKP